MALCYFFLFSLNFGGLKKKTVAEFIILENKFDMSLKKHKKTT